MHLEFEHVKNGWWKARAVECPENVYGMFFGQLNTIWARYRAWELSLRNPHYQGDLLPHRPRLSVIINHRQRGADDCLAGNSPASDNADYLRGYADQYALEQMLTNNTEGQ